MGDKSHLPRSAQEFVLTQSSLLQKANPHFFSALDVESLTPLEQEALFGVLNGVKFPVFSAKTVAWALIALTTDLEEFQRVYVLELSGFYGEIASYRLEKKSEVAVQHRIHVMGACLISHAS